MMPMSKLSTKIAVKDLLKLAECKHCGTLHELTKKGVFQKRTEWEEKYIVVCKGYSITWNLFVYPKRFALAADKTYSFLEIESVLEYNDVNEDVIGFIVKLVDPKEDHLIFRCDTKPKRKIWIVHFSTAILEAHNDSGYNSGGSVSRGKSRQSTGYDTIGEVEKSRPEDVSSTDTETDQMTNVSQIVARSQKSTEHTVSSDTATLHEESDSDAKGDSNKEAKHTYVNWSASFRRKEMGVKEDERGQRRPDETHMKEVYTGSVQESMTQMENLKWHLPKEGDNCAHHRLTDTTEIYRAQDIEKARRPSLITPNAGTDSIVSELHSIFSNKINANALHDEVSAHTSENNTVPKLPATPSLPSEHIDTASSSSYLIVQGYSGTKSEYLPFGEQHLHSTGVDSGAFLSVKGDAATSSSANEETPHSATVQSKTTTRMQDGNHKDSTSPDTASFFCLDGDETCSSSQKKTRLRTAQTLNNTLSSGTETCASDRDYHMSCTHKTSVSRRGDAQTPLHRTGSISRVPEEIHENDDHMIPEYKGESEPIEFSNNKDGSSFSSSDSKGSLTIPEEDTDYEKIFPRDAHFCNDQKSVKQIMKKVSIGTFLVCDGKKQNLEMYVMTPSGIEHFRIYKQVNKCSFYEDFSNQVLRNLDSLLSHYHNNNLPSNNYKVKLKRGYKEDRD